MYDVYVEGFVGNLGTSVLVENKYEELSQFFNKTFLDSNLHKFDGGVNPPLFMEKEKVIDEIDIGKGGFLAALWKLCERNNFGLEYNLSKVPISQFTVEITDYFDINPYRLLTKNAKIVIVDKSFGRIEEKAFLKHIGRITDTNKRIRIDNANESYLTKDYKDEIDLIIPSYTKGMKNI